jgi:hypothetical protein
MSEDISKAIKKYMTKHKNNVQFHASFLAFEGKECNVIDDIMFCYGTKESLLIDLTAMIKEIKKEKEFIDW